MKTISQHFDCWELIPICRRCPTVCRWCKHFDILNFDAGTWRETPIWIVHEKLKHKCAQWEINFFCFGPMCYQTICSSDQSIAWLTSMLILNILPLIGLFQEGLCASELLTILPDSTSGIKACNASGIGSFTRRRWKIPSSAQNFHSSVVQKGDCELECRRRRHFGIPWREGHVQAPDPQKWIWIRGSSILQLIKTEGLEYISYFFPRHLTAQTPSWLL